MVNNTKPLLHHGEVLWQDGNQVCKVWSTLYRHTLGSAVGLCMLGRREYKGPIVKLYIGDGVWSIKIGKDFYPCMVSLQPLYNLTGQRVKS